MLNDRYCIIELLGRGGMGEVYRADDLTLGQTIAIKLLTGEAARDAGRIEELRYEVRVARQVAHPNVCRVYDIAEAEGFPFLTMEYIDGENLASLLKRIGRLPQDKGLELARQLCAGLAAAHDSGVLHRDLKPSNVMIDGRGRARITDFGLAGVADRAGPYGVQAGTPAYMAPEQLAGREVSVRSDVFALGLVLYEIFTGQRAYRAETLAELSRLHDARTPRDPSTIVRELDPAIAAVVLRCLDKAPERRPASAVLVAAALPGGDPLAAALAAGETPSPELVAAAQESGVLRPRVGATCILIAIGGMLATAAINDRFDLIHLVPFEKPTAVLVDRAREVIRSFGYGDPPTDWDARFYADSAAVRFAHAMHPNPRDWTTFRSGGVPMIGLWYRQSPRELIPVGTSAQVGAEDPPMQVSGEIRMRLDTRGHLWTLKAIPSDQSPTSEPVQTVDWRPLFAAAGLEFSEFDTVEPEWTPSTYCDTRAAWRQRGEAADALRVEAGALSGRISFVRVIGPWTEPTRSDSSDTATRITLSSALVVIMVLGTLIAAGALAMRNLRLGRGDRRGAMRLAVFAVCSGTAAWAFSAHPAGPPRLMLQKLVESLGPQFFLAGTLWLTYMAVEPMIRRRAPQRLIGWTRLLAGRFTDPLVARDALLGTTAGVVLLLCDRVPLLTAYWMNWPADPPRVGAALESAFSLRDAMTLFLSMPITGLFNCAVFFGFASFLTIVLRREWLAAVIAIAFVGLAFGMAGQHWVASIPFALVGAAFWVLTPLRGGLLAGTAMFMTYVALQSAPLTMHVAEWHVVAGQIVVAAVAVQALAGFYFSLAGKRLFEAALRDA
ncbi:MAG: serine/threonine-protein kinase [Phycisphaerae bacterium]